MLASVLEPHPLIILPFLAMLLCIALMPLLLPKIWEHHLHQISLGLGSISVGYYWLALNAGSRLLHGAGEYVSFILFIGALFVVAGGIHIRVKGEATPQVNCLFLLIGAILANFVGTTGASMLLIRPWIRMNKYRFTGFHTAFFIFVVSNVGGCLTPIGDPPLFLGYLKGVPFFWISAQCWGAWLFAVSAIIAIFYFLDQRNFLRAPQSVRELETAHEEWKIDGLRNLGFLLLILGSVFLKSPPALREGLMLTAATASYLTTPKSIHEANHFSFAPIKEVAWLFLGIFSTMIPALDYLGKNAGSLGIHSPMQFYWISGALSAVLDNAPTYLSFLSASFGLHFLSLDYPLHMQQMLSEHSLHLVAISLGSVFFGAMTYIGNGPNFMVKAIAEHAKVHTPGFFSYIFKFSIPVLIPIFLVVGWLFLRAAQ